MMKKFTLLSLVLTVITLGTNVYAQQNTDQFGYSFLTSADSAGPAFEWIDITDTSDTRIGTKVFGLGDDNGVGPYDMGFDFKFYLGDFSKIYLGVNGYVGFNKGTVLSPPFPIIPTPAGKANNFIAPFLADLNFGGAGNPGRMFYWSNNRDTFIVTFDKVPFWVADEINPEEYGQLTNTFQIVLSAVDSSITFNYLDIAPVNETASGFQAGIENLSGSIGLKCIDTALPPSNFSIKFDYPEVITGEYKDISVNWVLNEDNGGEFKVLTGDTMSFLANVQNVGNVVMNLIKLDVRVKEGANQARNFGTITLNQLAPGKDTTLLIGKFLATKAVPHSVEIISTTSGDAVPSNNRIINEFNPVNINNKSYRLSYSNLDNNDENQHGFAGANNGSAVLIVPPVYPCKITDAEFYVKDINSTEIGAPLLGGFKFYIVSADINTANPLDTLYAGVVTEEDASNMQLLTIKLDSIITINEQSVFLIFNCDSDYTIQTELVSPISNRAYEITQGAISPYRSGSTEEFEMGLIIEGLNTSIQSVAAKNFGVGQNFPNPAEHTTLIPVELTEASTVTLEIRDLTGKTLKTLNLGTVAAGKHQYNVNLSEFNAGMYLYTVAVNGKTVTKKMIVNN